MNTGNTRTIKRIINLDEPVASNISNISCRRLTPGDSGALADYLFRLSDITRSRFGPHPFDQQNLQNFYAADRSVIGYVAERESVPGIIAYAVVKLGVLTHDSERLSSYGIAGLENNACTFAPSVADAWQSKGVGKKLFNFILTDLEPLQVTKMILWGGVQATNDKATWFYKKLGFQILGAFDYNGANYDMILHINYTSHNTAQKNEI